MEKPFISNKVFDKINFTTEPLITGEYDKCRFTNCDLSGKDLSAFQLMDCEFVNCNLSLIKTNKTAVQGAVFKDCKLLGVRFDTCNPFLFSARFENCQLNLSSFYKLNLKKILFRNCMLHEVDFTEADLSSSLLDNCDLAMATFDHTVLEKADLRTSYNYTINPEQNKLKKARFSLAGLPGLLHQYGIDIE